MQIQKFAQKFVIYNPKRDAILAGKYLTSKYLPEKLVNKLCLPGGQVEFGQIQEESAIQEVLEETGVLIKPWEILNTWTWVYEKEKIEKQIFAIGRVGLYVSGKIRRPKREKETSLGRARWIKIRDIKPDQFVFDEIPAINLFLAKYRCTKDICNSHSEFFMRHHLAITSIK